MLETLFQHPGRFQTKQDVEQVQCVTAQQCAGEYCDVAGTGGERPKGVALGRVSSLQLVHLIGNRIVKKVVHLPTDEVDGCKAPDLLAICLPKRTVERPAGMICFFRLAQRFTELHLLEVHRQEAFALCTEVDRRPTVGIDDAALVTAAAGNLVSVPPEVPELTPISSDYP